MLKREQRYCPYCLSPHSERTIIKGTPPDDKSQWVFAPIGGGTQTYKTVDCGEVDVIIVRADEYITREERDARALARGVK